MVCKTSYCLMQVKSIAECSKGSILQYFRPSLSYNLSLRALFCLFFGGHLRQVLLYIVLVKKGINTCKPSILFMGHRQTVQTQIRRHIMWCLIRIFTICLQNEIKICKKGKLPSNTPKIGNGIALLIWVSKSIGLR